MYQDGHVGSTATLPLRPLPPLKAISYASTKPSIPPKSSKRTKVRNKLQKRQISSSKITAYSPPAEPRDCPIKEHVGHLMRGEKEGPAVPTRGTLGGFWASDSKIPSKSERRSSDDTVYLPTPLSVTTPTYRPELWQRPGAASRNSADSAYYSSDSSPTQTMTRETKHIKSLSRSSTDSAYQTASEMASGENSPEASPTTLSNENALPTWQISSPTNSTPSHSPNVTVYNLPHWSDLSISLPTTFQARSASPSSRYGRETPPPNYTESSTTPTPALNVDSLLTSAELLAEQYRTLLHSRNSTRGISTTPISQFHRGPTPPPKPNAVPVPPKPIQHTPATPPPTPPKEFRHLATHLRVPNRSPSPQQALAYSVYNGTADHQISQIDRLSPLNIPNIHDGDENILKNEFGSAIFRSASAIPTAMAISKPLRRKPQLCCLRSAGVGLGIGNWSGMNEQSEVLIEEEEEYEDEEICAEIYDKMNDDIYSETEGEPTAVRYIEDDTRYQVPPFPTSSTTTTTTTTKIQNLIKIYQQLQAELLSTTTTEIGISSTSSREIAPLNSDEEEMLKDMNEAVGNWLSALEGFRS